VHESGTVCLNSEICVKWPWSSAHISDMVSDSVVAVIINCEGSKVAMLKKQLRSRRDIKGCTTCVGFAILYIYSRFEAK
jgi:hypothetical protein